MQRVGGPFERVLRGFVRNVAVPFYQRRLSRFQTVLNRACSHQREWLLRRISKCRETKFGRDHHFSTIQSVMDFRRQVPVSTYDYFSPYINAVARRDFQALLPPDEEVTRFTITTGSTGIPKLNPVTATWFREYRETWDLWGLKMLVDHPGYIGGKVIQMPGTWDMGKTEGGLPISMVSTLMSKYQHPIVKLFQAVPMCVCSDISDPVARFYTIIRLTAGDAISVVCQMNPGALVRLAEIGDQYRETLIRDIADGTLTTDLEIPNSVRQAIAGRITRPDCHKAMQFAKAVERDGHLYPRHYWPAPIVSCWLGGTAGFQSRYLSHYFGESPLREMGLVSSEGRHTIPIADDKPEGVLAATSNYYEFVPVAEIDSPDTRALEGHELEIDADYFMLMTTSSGYYRFNIGDIVRCRGFVGEAPLLEFLQKGDRCADLEGEKVTEIQFVQVADQVAHELGIRPRYVTVVPCRPKGTPPCYVVAIEYGDVPDRGLAQQYADRIDRGLIASNFLYRAKRREQVLGPLLVKRIPDGAWLQYLQREAARRGTGDAQYKHPALVLDSSWLDQFTAVDMISASIPAA